MVSPAGGPRPACHCLGWSNIAVSALYAVCSVPQLRRLAAGLVKIWESSTGSLTGTLEGPGDAIDWLQWHPKGNVLLAGSEDFSAWMWSAETGIMMQVRPLSCCPPVLCMYIAADGQHRDVAGPGPEQMPACVCSPCYCETWPADRGIHCLARCSRQLAKLLCL